MTHSVSYTKDGDLGIVTVNNPPVNALSQHVRQGLSESLRPQQATTRKP